MNFLFCALILALAISSLKSESFAKLFLHKVSFAPEAKVEADVKAFAVVVARLAQRKLLFRLKLNQADA